MQRTRLALAQITCDPAVQVRDRIDPAVVEQYADDWDLLPPVAVFRLPDGRLLLADGWHRYAAARKLDLGEIEAIVHEGDYVALCDYAGRVNMSGMRALSKSERHRVIAESYERHKPISQEDLAGLLAISQKTVSRVLTIEAVKDDLPELSKLTKPMPGPRAPGRPKQPIMDSHLVELAEAPRVERAALAQATAERAWTPRETRAAVAEIADPATPHERKEELRAGTSDPIMRMPDGQIAALPETFAREMARPVGGEAYRIYKAAAVHLAQLVTIPPAEVIAGLSLSDLTALAQDSQRLPRYISVLEAIQGAAREALRPTLREVR